METLDSNHGPKYGKSGKENSLEVLNKEWHVGNPASHALKRHRCQIFVDAQVLWAVYLLQR